MLEFWVIQEMLEPHGWVSVESKTYATRKEAEAVMAKYKQQPYSNPLRVHKYLVIDD